MGKSLQEQLLEQGLVKKQQVHQHKQSSHKQQKRRRGGAKDTAPSMSEEARARAAEAEAEKRARDKELNRERDERAARRARRIEIEQTIASARADRVPGDELFQFVDNDKVKRIYVTAEVRKGLVEGALSVLRIRRTYAVVDSALAERLAAEDPFVRPSATATPGGDGADADEYYDRFEVPDDLSW